MYSVSLALLLVPIVSAGLGFPSLPSLVRDPQKICVKGQLKCDGVAQTELLVQLWERDGFGTGIGDADDLLSSIKSDSNGDFELCGSDDEIMDIEPYVLIHHHCGAREGCVKIFNSKAPSGAIGGTYDMQTVNLEKQILNTKEKCA